VGLVILVVRAYDSQNQFFCLAFSSLQARPHLYFAHSLLLAALLVLGLLLGLLGRLLLPLALLLPRLLLTFCC